MVFGFSNCFFLVMTTFKIYSLRRRGKQSGKAKGVSSTGRAGGPSKLCDSSLAAMSASRAGNRPRAQP